MQGDLTLIQAPNDDPAALQSHLVVTPKDLFLNQHEVSQLMGSPTREQQDQRNSQDSSLAGAVGAEKTAENQGPDGLPQGDGQIQNARGTVDEDDDEEEEDGEKIAADAANALAASVGMVNSAWLPTVDLM